MTSLFVALGITVLALLALLLWFVPHLLQQQANRVANETKQLREMLLDLLNEQEAVTLRQTQLGSSLSQLRDQIEKVAKIGYSGSDALSAHSNRELQVLEYRVGELQHQLHDWFEHQRKHHHKQASQDNESWAYLLSLLSTVQERVHLLSEDRAQEVAGVQAQTLLTELEQEMGNLRGISQDIEKLQWRLRRSLHDRHLDQLEVTSSYK
ncbi:MAG: hypothetical protein GFH27_549279n150 [Chloroflexi bacterium AL-W]|nr:hypothetical protein [Chloroflexi bacterium AL-N1]NOK65116.1 hypothetical protein [Chloroflexi bacterium AL-N10]NOK72617.1 hypothetical protein [Chloroflexi bacterium AL-N5]NOK79295.1 hypothetical protein [Chloroflexi bacterium AL-W]NOK87211.1 hypothetical protein [Chloroflexi bacterium AL-N15]